MIRRELFQSFIMGGFECSTHRNRDGKRIDVIAATRHDYFARADYQRLIDFGIRTARDGARWHLIERSPYEYDFSSVIKQIRAARATGLQVIWDLFHYGFPEDLDFFSEEFVSRFTSFAGAFTNLLLDEGVEAPVLCPVNEISFFSWIAGDVGLFYPYAENRGDEVKRQLVKAAIAASQRIKRLAPDAVLIQTEPLIRVVSETGEPEDIIEAENYNLAQYDAIDMLIGRREPELGGSRELLDVIGINYYPHNQWLYPSRQFIPHESPDYKPFSELLRECYERYGKPLLIAETGTEDESRTGWFRYVCGEVRAAMMHGVPIPGICHYPIVNHPGWDDDRHCRNGLWCYPGAAGEREIYEPLAAEIKRQQMSFVESYV